MDLNDTPEQARYREKVRGWLEEHASEAPVVRGRHPRAAGVAGAARRCRARRRDVAGRGRRPGPRARRAGHRQPGDRARGRARRARRDRRRDARPDDHRPRHRGAEGPLPRADAARRRGLVPALLRARGRARTSRRSSRAPSLQDDGSWRLSGQKVWTTNAHFAAFGMLLARTDPDVPKHKGLTMFLVPMDAPGVTIRPLRQISGDPEFNEVFFDDVALDADAVVRAGRRRLGHGADDAHVRARDDRAGVRGDGLPRRPLRARDRRRRGRARAIRRCGAGSASCASSCWR